jgi:hypothetical protein
MMQNRKQLSVAKTESSHQAGERKGARGSQNNRRNTSGVALEASCTLDPKLYATVHYCVHMGDYFPCTLRKAKRHSQQWREGGGRRETHDR